MFRSSRRRGGGLLRVATMLPFLPMAGRASTYARLLWALVADPRVPTSRKALLGLAGAYIVSPFDLVPERIPFVGAIDDVAVMVLAVDVFLEGLPESLVDEKLAELGMSRAELDDDLSRVRRVVPGALRRVVARVPAALDGAAQVMSQTGADRRLKSVMSRAIGPRTQETPA